MLGNTKFAPYSVAQLVITNLVTEIRPIFMDHGHYILFYCITNWIICRATSNDTKMTFN